MPFCHWILLVVLALALLINDVGKRQRSLFLVLVVDVSSRLVHSSYHEEQLFKELFQNYNPLIRPVRKVEETVTVSFSIALLQLINVIEKEQVLKTNVWLQVVRRKRTERILQMRAWPSCLSSPSSSSSRNGTITKCNGNERSTAVSSRYVFRPVKSGHLM